MRVVKIASCNLCPMSYVDMDSYQTEFFLNCNHPDYDDIVKSGDSYPNADDITEICPLRHKPLKIELE